MARDAEDRGQRAEALHRLKVGQIKGQQMAQIGASGRDFSGSSANLLEDTTVMGELDAYMIRENAQREAYGQRVAAINSLAEGRLDLMKGRYGAAGTLLSGGAAVGARYKKAYGT
jgi:hypothetical protein